MNYIYKDELYHHGIKGQKWGVRRFQLLNGSYTQAGKERYRNKLADKAYNKYMERQVAYNNLNNLYEDLKKNGAISKTYRSGAEEYGDPSDKNTLKEITEDVYNSMENCRKEALAWFEKRHDLLDMDLSTVSKKDIKKKYTEWDWEKYPVRTGFLF